MWFGEHRTISDRVCVHGYAVVQRHLWRRNIGIHVISEPVRLVVAVSRFKAVQDSNVKTYQIVSRKLLT